MDAHYAAFVMRHSMHMRVHGCMDAHGIMPHYAAQHAYSRMRMDLWCTKGGKHWR